MRYLICACVLFLCLLKLTFCNLTACQISQQHFADMCFSPTPDLKIDYEWLQGNQPADGWHINIGNDVAQFHFSEAIKKKVLNRTDDFSEACMRIIIDHTTGDGQLTGYGGQISGWACNNLLDFPGTRKCDLQLDHTKFHEDVVVYMSHQDENTKLATVIYCFPNGQVGWVTISKHPQLTDEERQITTAHAEKLGFPKDTHKTLYGDKCPQ